MILCDSLLNIDTGSSHEPSGSIKKVDSWLTDDRRSITQRLMA